MSMKKLMIVAASVGFMTQTFAADQNSQLTDKKSQLSYTLGIDIGRNFKKLDVSIDPQIVAEGIVDGLHGTTPKLSQDQMQKTMVNFQKEMITKRQDLFKKIASENAEAGQKYLDENKNKPGVQTLPSGLQYKIVTAGSGRIPNAMDMVKVDYEGQLIDGKVFDSSYKRGKPVKFMVRDVIPAWSEALQLMKTGSTWMLYAPAKLAYGMHGIGPIGPNQALVFKIHLIDIENGNGHENQKSASTPAAANPATAPAGKHAKPEAAADATKKDKS